MSKRVLVTGITGQDGSNMVDYLLENTDCLVYGMSRRSSNINLDNCSTFIDNERFQLVYGDLTDGFGGCPTIGGVKASRVLANKKDLPEMWEAVLAEYKRQKLDEDYALTQARLARILRASDWNDKKKEPILWKI